MLRQTDERFLKALWTRMLKIDVRVWPDTRRNVKVVCRERRIGTVRLVIEKRF
jgi:hypothetical protein